MGSNPTLSATIASLMTPLRVFSAEARSILVRTSGFIADAGFSHSLTPARNCTFGCTYCYVPTLRIYGGLQREDWERWGQFTTAKSNAAALLAKELRPGQTIYCSPLVDPYQPAEEQMMLMPDILEALCLRPPQVFVVQTRGSLIERDIEALRRLSRVTTLRISYSLTTNRDEAARWYEPRCDPFPRRLQVMRTLRDAGLNVFATLAPLLPCDVDGLVDAALEASENPLIVDPLHIRGTKQNGATTRDEARRIAEVRGHAEWFDAGFQRQCLDRMRARAAAQGRRLVAGREGFALLSAAE